MVPPLFLRPVPNVVMVPPLFLRPVPNVVMVPPLFLRPVPNVVMVPPLFLRPVPDVGMVPPLFLRPVPNVVMVPTLLLEKRRGAHHLTPFAALADRSKTAPDRRHDSRTWPGRRPHRTPGRAADATEHPAGPQTPPNTRPGRGVRLRRAAAVTIRIP
jgi:hypothetical protein